MKVFENGQFLEEYLQQQEVVLLAAVMWLVSRVLGGCAAVDMCTGAWVVQCLCCR